MKKISIIVMLSILLPFFLSAGTDNITVKSLSIDEFEKRFSLIEKIRMEYANLLSCSKDEIDSRTFDIYIIEHGALEDGDVVQDTRLYNLSFMRDPTKLFYNWGKKS